jgi:hypothetical protein
MLRDMVFLMQGDIDARNSRQQLSNLILRCLGHLNHGGGNRVMLHAERLYSKNSPWRGSLVIFSEIAALTILSLFTVAINISICDSVNFTKYIPEFLLDFFIL